MEVFSKYFRRLLVGNAPQIFPGISRTVENAGNYQLLVQEMVKVSQDPEQSQKIAETIDTSDGDIFRDFDLSTFMDQFKLDPIAKTALALAFKGVSRADLRTKGKSRGYRRFHYRHTFTTLTLTSECNTLKSHQHRLLLEEPRYS